MADQKSILIVDDDITSLDIVSFLFEEKGYQVQRCADGLAALEYTKDNKPDLIVMDLMMPEISGSETVRTIRSQGMTDVPIIAFTAVDEIDVHLEAQDAGCNEILTKPCRPNKLIKHVEGLLKK